MQWFAIFTFVKMSGESGLAGGGRNDGKDARVAACQARTVSIRLLGT